MLVMTVSAPVARAASIIRVKPMGVGTWPCGSTWATACAFLQTAVTNAASGDEIWVVAGVHKPSYGTDRTITFQLKSNMALYGGFAGTETLRTQRNPAANVTILSGDIDSNDVNTDGNETAETTADIVGSNAYHVVTGAAGVILDGLIITAGDADSGSNCPSNGCGGGLYNYANSSTVTDVIFSGNYAAYVGGGMANVSQGFDFPSDAVLSKVTFVGNGSGSTGGGLYNYLNNATLTNVTFKSNSAPYGGAMHNHSYASVTVTNVTFKGNWSYDGRALYNDNVTYVTVRNSILWNDGALEIENDDTSHVYISNSVLSGGCPTGFAANTDCTNLTTTDPVLGTLANYGGNVPTLPLLPGSSATSATTTNCPATDARGIARAATCDLGAFESRGFVLTKTSGDNQIAAINTVFANPLGLTIAAIGAGEPVDGGRLAFTPPASGASATIVSNPATVASGMVTATATANGTNGAYTVTVAADPAATVNFSLNNSSTLYAKPGGLTTGACSSWANACELRYALNSIGAGEIWVAAGTYTPITTTDRTATFQIKSDVAIYGGFAMTETLQSQRNPAANVVILSGDIGVIGNNSDNAYHVVTGATGATLDGVTISGGNANVGSTCPGNDCGGGMANTNANPTLNNVIFRNNSATIGGGLYNHVSSPTLTNVTFRDNSATNGGGLSNYLSSPTLTNVSFSGNSAIFKGGGLYNDTSSTPTLINVTISGNSAPNGGGIYSDGSTLTLKNVLIANSTGGGDCQQASSTINAASSNNLIESTGFAACGLTNGTNGNLIGIDPSLGALADNGSSTPTFALLPNSPAIDAGNTASCLPMDQRGETRDDLRCDIGAYELKYPDSPTVIRSTSSTTMTTYGPALIGLQHNAAVNPGVITVTKSLTWEPESANTIDAHWYITPTLDAGLNLTLTLCYPPTESNGLNLTDLRFWKFSAGAWSAVPGTPVTSTVGLNLCATLNGINELSVWTLAIGAPTATLPPNVTTQAATSITSNGATLNGTVRANGSSTMVTFEYGLTTGYGNTVIASPSLVTGTSDTLVNAAIMGLTPNTTYNYRVVGVNAGGTTNGSNRTFTTTLLCAAAITVVNANDSGAGSLRQAIADICAGGTITFGGDYTITLASQLEINKPVTITGTGQHVTLDGNHAVRVIHIASDDYSGGYPTFNHLNIVNGQITGVDCGGSPVSCGGGMFLEIQTGANIANSTFYNNTGGPASAGGAIYADYAAAVNITNTTFASNTANLQGGAIDCYHCTLTLQNNTFYGNSIPAGYGGTINNTSGTINFRNTIFVKTAGPNACDNAAGVFNDGGGNLKWGDVSCPGTNANPMLGVLGSYGGEVPTIPLLPGSAAINATFTYCPTADARGVARGGTCDSGAYESRGFSLTKVGGDNQRTMVNTAFANPLVLTVSETGGNALPGALVNFAGPASGAGIFPTSLNATADSTGVVSRSLTANSVAGGPYNLVVSAIGANSLNFSLANDLCASTIIVTNAYNNGAGSLRQAIVDTCTGGTIAFDNDYTITLASQLELNKTITITGQGHRITFNGNHTVRVLHVPGGVHPTLDRLHIINGNFSGNDCAGSAVACGGGMMLETNAAATVTNCTFSGNGAASGGVLAGAAIYSNLSNLTVTNSTFSDNKASAYGGAIDVFYGSVMLTNNTFYGNSVGGYGGALLNTWGTVTFRNNIFANNTTGIGGDCNNTSGTFNDGGGNLLWGDTLCPGINADPKLSTLGYYGGDTPTSPLLPGSAAIDAGNAIYCPATDQRGETRDDLHCDSGAYELKYPDSPTVIRSVSSVTSTTFGPALMGIQRDAAFTDPSMMTVTKEAWSRPGAESISALWAITPTVTSGFSLTLQLCITPTERHGLSEGSLFFYRSDGITYTKLITAPTWSTVNAYRCAALSGITQLSRWTLATDTPTAVTLHDLTASARSASIGWAGTIGLVLAALLVLSGGLWLKHKHRPR